MRTPFHVPAVCSRLTVTTATSKCPGMAWMALSHNVCSMTHADRHTQCHGPMVLWQVDALLPFAAHSRCPVLTAGAGKRPASEIVVTAVVCRVSCLLKRQRPARGRDDTAPLAATWWRRRLLLPPPRHQANERHTANAYYFSRHADARVVSEFGVSRITLRAKSWSWSWNGSGSRSWLACTHRQPRRTRTARARPRPVHAVEADSTPRTFPARHHRGRRLAPGVVNQKKKEPKETHRVWLH